MDVALSIVPRWIVTPGASIVLASSPGNTRAWTEKPACTAAAASERPMEPVAPVRKTLPRPLTQVPFGLRQPRPRTDLVEALEHLVSGHAVFSDQPRVQIGE